MTMLWSKDFQILPTFHVGRFYLCVYLGGVKERSDEWRRAADN
jgi:hypothetical protein